MEEWTAFQLMDKNKTDDIISIGDFTQVDAQIFKHGTVEIQSEMLDRFNHAVTEITHKY